MKIEAFKCLKYTKKREEKWLKYAVNMSQICFFYRNMQNMSNEI